MENKPASLLVMPLRKAFSAIFPSQSHRQRAGRSQASSLLQFDSRLVMLVLDKSKQVSSAKRGGLDKVKQLRWKRL